MLVPQSFKNPPLGDLQLVSQLLQYNARYSPEHPWFVHGASPNELKTITWSEAGQAFKRAAQQVVKPSNPTDTITYHTLYSGILTAGGTAFLISTINSSAAVAHLLKKTGTHTLFVSTDEAILNLASSALEDAQNDGHEVDILSAPTFQELFSKDTENKDLDPQPSYPKNGTDSPAIILHSSGSTAFPKPTSISHRLILQWAKMIRISGVELSHHRLAAHALPVFHGMGFFLGPWSACTGLTLAAFSPEQHRVIPSPDNVLEAAVASRSTFILSVPVFLEMWSLSAEDMSKLKLFNGILFGGGPLNKRVGDELEKAGISIMCRYGATEIGPGTVLMETKRSRTEEEWDWLKVRADIKIKLMPQEGDPGLFELVYLETDTYSPAVANCQVDGTRAFATNDLVIRHPTDPRKFKIYGRKDDQIMLSSGEKTNPGPICVIICRDPLVDFAVMFGRGRPQNGIIVQPTEGHEIDPGDPVALARFRDAIWPSVEQANAFAPSHSRLHTDMILVAHPFKPFEMTAKHIPRVPVVIETYKTEIEAAYEAVGAASQTGVPPPSAWTSSEVYDFIKKVVHMAIDKAVADNDDIFQQGGDSLQATYIRNAIIHALRQDKPELTGHISQGFIYASPSVSCLTARLLAIVGRSSDAEIDSAEPKLKELEELISEFTVDFPKHRASIAELPYPGEVVLLTGSTGGLGNQLLSHLSSMHNVSHIYAINRRASDGKPLRERQMETLAERGLDVGIVDSPRVTLVEGDMAAWGFGIDRSLFDVIRNSITLIIHNAWRVNFNLALGSFRPMIQGVRNLIDLAPQSPQGAPPRLIFTGSVGVFRNWKGPGRPLEAPIQDANLVIGSGYSESKWVSERVLEEAAKTTPLRPIVVRVGQMTSNSSGAWSSRDWLPAIIRSGQVLGMLPMREPVPWISMDTAARAIVDFRSSNAQYLHLAHPDPVPWNTAMGAFASLLKVPLVSWDQWLSELLKDSIKPDNNPAALLADFFCESPPTGMENREGHGMPALDLKEALKASPTLSDPCLPRVGPVDVERWVDFWTCQKLLTPNNLTSSAVQAV